MAGLLSLLVMGWLVFELSFAHLNDLRLSLWSGQLTWGGGNRNWSGRGHCNRRRGCEHWRWGCHCDWSWRCQRNWRVVSHFGLERVTVDVGRLSNNLVTNMTVADDSVSCLHCLQDGGWARNCMHSWRLRDESLAVDCG